MIDRSHVLYHVVYLDHDGTWTWSVESGKAFTENHRTYGFDTGYPTQGAARTAALEKIAQIEAQRQEERRSPPS